MRLLDGPLPLFVAKLTRPAMLVGQHDPLVGVISPFASKQVKPVWPSETPDGDSHLKLLVMQPPPMASPHRRRSYPCLLNVTPCGVEDGVARHTELASAAAEGGR